MTNDDDNNDADTDVIPVGKNKRRDHFAALLAKLALPSPWPELFTFIAYRESAWNPAAANTTASEARAAAKSYDRNAAKLSKCGHPRSEYVWGSGGYGGFLPAVGMLQFGEETNRCLPPREAVHSDVTNLAMMAGFGRGLSGWPGFKRDPTFVNMALGWGWPAKMGNDPAYRAAKVESYAKKLRKIGLPTSLLETPLPSIGLDGDAALKILRGGVA